MPEHPLPAEARLSSGKIPPLDHDEDLLLRVEVAAPRLQLSRAQMFRLLAAGETTSVKIGASRRVPLRSLHEYVKRLITEQG